MHQLWSENGVKTMDNYKSVCVRCIGSFPVIASLIWGTVEGKGTVRAMAYHFFAGFGFERLQVTSTIFEFYHSDPSCLSVSVRIFGPASWKWSWQFLHLTFNFTYTVFRALFYVTQRTAKDNLYASWPQGRDAPCILIREQWQQGQNIELHVFLITADISYRFERAEIVTRLLERGADPFIESDNHLTPLHSAARRGLTEICRVLLRDPRLKQTAVKCKRVTPFHLACLSGNRETCELFLASCEDVLMKSAHYTPLHFAAWLGNENICEFLIETGNSFIFLGFLVLFWLVEST